MVYPTTKSMLELSLSPEKDIATETSLQVFIKQHSDSAFQVLDLYQRIPKFAMYAEIDTLNGHLDDLAQGRVNFVTVGNPSPISSVAFLTTEGLSKSRAWKKEKFILASSEARSPVGQASDVSHFLCLRVNLPLVIAFEPNHNQQKVCHMRMACWTD